MTTLEVLDKVKKLLSLSKSNNQHEAALAAQRAQELLDKHRLSEAMLVDHQAEPVKDFHDDPLDKALGGSWKTRLASTIARQNVCRIYRGGGSIYLVGSPNNVNTVRYLYNWLAREIDCLCIIDGCGHSQNWQQNYCIGAVETVIKRLREASQNSVQQMKEEFKNGGLEIVLVDNALARIDQERQTLDKWIKDNLRLVAGRGTSLRHNDSARQQGRQAGDKVRIGPSSGALKQTLRLK